MSNEMERYEERLAAESGGVSLEPDPSLEEGGGAEDRSGEFDGDDHPTAAQGIDPKKKKLVTMGIGGGLAVILLAAVAIKLSGGSPPKEEFLAAVPAPVQSQPAAPVGLNDASPVVSPTQGGAAPMVFGDSTQPGAPAAESQVTQSSAGQAPVGSTGQQHNKGIQGATSPASVAPTAPPSKPGAIGPNPSAGFQPDPGHSPTVQNAPGGGAPVYSPVATSPAGVGKGGEPSSKEAALAVKVKDLEQEIETLKKKLAEKPVASAVTPKPAATAAKPYQAPVVAAKPSPRPAQAAPKPSAEPSEAGPAVSVKAEDLRGVVTKPGAKPTSGKVRGDFTVYAVTDGRVWVVGKDGERLGPLAIGSPLTDGSKITGIDIVRGEVNTSAGVIQ